MVTTAGLTLSTASVMAFSSTIRTTSGAAAPPLLGLLAEGRRDDDLALQLAAAEEQRVGRRSEASQGRRPRR